VVAPQPAFSIRRAERSDGQSILDCLQAAFEPYRKQYTPGAFADTVLALETLDQRFVTMTILVATGASGEIVGTVAGQAVNEEEGHIRGMAVRPHWQGQGVADALLSAVEAELCARRCSRITLDTTAALQRAMRFYQRHGYHGSGKVTDFFGMPLFEYVKVF
jgi:ribosomal protein S18 acetylase RimI-like enzyme